MIRSKVTGSRSGYVQIINDTVSSFQRATGYIMSHIEICDYLYRRYDKK